MRRIPLTALCAGVLLLAAPSCSPTGSEAPYVDGPGVVLRQGNVVTGTGTVRWYEIEGGFFAIRGDDDTTYDPVNLPAGFRTDGLRVQFRARVRDDLAGFHMVGPIVEIGEIAKL